MSFPRYESYSLSDIPWIEELPAGWKTQRLKTVFQLMARPVRDEDEIVTAFRDGEVTLRNKRRQEGFTNALQEIGYQGVRVNDLVIHAMDAFAGAIGVSDSEGKSTPVYSVCRPWNAATSSKYYGSLLRYMALSGYINSLAKGIRERSTDFRWSDSGNVLVPVPPKQEQASIVIFIEKETRKIDALIEEQQRLIALLKEKRQATVAHAVTKGFDRDVEMTDSGSVELGHVPKHWKVTPLGYFSRLHRGHDLTSDQQEEGPYPVVTSGGITGFHSAYIAKAPGVVTGRYGSTGRLFYIEENYWPHNTSLYVSDFFRNDPRFVWYSLQAINFESHSAKSAVPGIDRNDLHVLPIAVPPREEQTAIVRHLDALMQEFESLSAEALRAIELLQERRSALIAAAVTGKIDVRAALAKPIMRATQFSSGFAHQLLAAEILDRCNSQRMGRIKLQKLIHLCEYHGQVSEVQGDYSRKAAGPFDARAMAGISKNLKKQKWFEEVKEGERYVYRPLEKRGEHKKYLAHWQTEMPRIDEVLSLIGNFKTRECEIVSTLYAAWNDLLIDGESTDDAAILHEASSAERWHESKEQIAPERWTKALQWMKEKGLVPVGYGKHTRHTAGQIGPTTEEAHEPA